MAKLKQYNIIPYQPLFARSEETNQTCQILSIECIPYESFGYCVRIHLKSYIDFDKTFSAIDVFDENGILLNKYAYTCDLERKILVLRNLALKREVVNLLARIKA